jgi:hypothetical protein
MYHLVTNPKLNALALRYLFDLWERLSSPVRGQLTGFRELKDHLACCPAFKPEFSSYYYGKG